MLPGSGDWTVYDHLPSNPPFFLALLEREEMT
jgi:hypothetical protein